MNNEVLMVEIFRKYFFYNVDVNTRKVSSVVVLSIVVINTM